MEVVNTEFELHKEKREGGVRIQDSNPLDERDHKLVPSGKILSFLLGNGSNIIKTRGSDPQKKRYYLMRQKAEKLKPKSLLKSPRGMKLTSENLFR